jgi:hypothetical protein
MPTDPMHLTPPDRIGYDVEPGGHDAPVDEVVGQGFYHIERMSDQSIWIQLGTFVGWLSVNGNKLEFVQADDLTDEEEEEDTT